MQVDPSKPTLKAPGAKRLKLNMMTRFQVLVSNFSLRRYTLVRERSGAASVAERAMTDAREEVAGELHRRDAELSALVGRCGLTQTNPC